MPPNISFSAWNIHGLASKVLGDKTKNKDFVDSANKKDFVFLNETWSNTEINVPGFKAFVSDTAVPTTNKACRISGGITLLVKTKFEKYVTIVKNSKNFLWCNVSKDILKTDLDLFLCGVYIPPEKSAYFDYEIFDELENDIVVSFASKGNTMILGDFNARTCKLEDFVSKEGNNFINDTSENCLQPKIRQSFDNNINNHGKKLINLCKNTDLRILNQ
jgi:hypothetical protein